MSHHAAPLRALAALFVLTLIAAGCGSRPPAGTAPDVQSAFKKTPEHVREFADEGVAAESRGEFSIAFVRYRALSLNPELTQEQRDAAAQSMQRMSQKLREAAEKGDKEAEQILDNYRVTK